MEFSITFLKILFWGIYLIAPILLLLGVVIVTLGLVVGRIESWTKFDALYWAFITALTVGYGDIRPKKKSSRILSTMIAIIGIGSLMIKVIKERIHNKEDDYYSRKVDK